MLLPFALAGAAYRLPERAAARAINKGLIRRMAGCMVFPVIVLRLKKGLLYHCLALRETLM